LKEIFTIPNIILPKISPLIESESLGKKRIVQPDTLTAENQLEDIGLSNLLGTAGAACFESDKDGYFQVSKVSTSLSLTF